MSGRARLWATGHDRESRVLDATTGFSVRFTERKTFECSNLSCAAVCDGPALFCDLHLWTFDNPTLEQAPIMGRVDVL